MSGFAWLIGLIVVGGATYAIFHTDETPKLGTTSTTGDTIEDLPGSTTDGLTIEQLMDLTLGKPDVVARLVAEGQTAPAVRTSAIAAWYGPSAEAQAQVSVESYMLARNLDIVATGGLGPDGLPSSEIKYVQTTKAPISAASGSLLIDVSTRFGNKAIATAKTESDKDKVVAALKEQRRAADQAAATGSSIVGAAGYLKLDSDSTADDGSGGGGTDTGGGVATAPPYKAPLDELSASDDVKAVFNADQIAQSKVTVATTWDTGTTEERVTLSNTFYGTARGFNVTPSGDVTAMPVKPAWSPRTVDDYNELSDLFANRAIDQDPARAADATTVITGVRAAIDAAALSSFVSSATPSSLGLIPTGYSTPFG